MERSTLSMDPCPLPRGTRFATRAGEVLRPRSQRRRWAVTISGFGSFRMRDKRAREGRNPKTGESAPIPARRVVTFRSSAN